jgi:hypothetical protein
MIWLKKKYHEGNLHEKEQAHLEKSSWSCMLMMKKIATANES